MGAGVAAAGATWVLRTANSAPALSSYKPKNPGGLTEVFAADGKTRLGFIQSDDLVQPVAASEFPKVLNEATVAIEDERFYKHKGVDYEGLIRAAVKNATKKKTVQGGSTLTMQLVRNLYTGDDTRSGLDGYKRKIKEAKLARDLEEIHPKSWVLGKYLNTVPYGTVGGQSAIGAGAAARLYFNKRVQDLTLREAAMLAGMPQAPSTYSPVLNPSGTKQRRNEVLGKMAAARLHLPGDGQGDDEEGPRAADGPLLPEGPRALRPRLRPVRADQAVRRQRRQARRVQGLHDDRPQEAGGGARGDQRQARRASARPRRSSRSTPPTATSSRWRRRRSTASRSSTSPPRAIASPAPPSRSWCC